MPPPTDPEGVANRRGGCATRCARGAFPRPLAGSVDGAVRAPGSGDPGLPSVTLSGSGRAGSGCVRVAGLLDPTQERQCQHEGPELPQPDEHDMEHQSKCQRSDDEPRCPGAPCPNRPPRNNPRESARNAGARKRAPGTLRSSHPSTSPSAAAANTIVPVPAMNTVSSKRSELSGRANTVRTRCHVDSESTDLITCGRALSVAAPLSPHGVRDGSRC